MMPVFADTSYFIALISPDDRHHKMADEFSQLVDRLVTTEWVLLELADGISDTINRQLLVPVRDSLVGNPSIQVVPLSMELNDRAISLYVSRPDKEWSLTDCVSFTVMTDCGITDALTTVAISNRLAFGLY